MTPASECCVQGPVNVASKRHASSAHHHASSAHHHHASSAHNHASSAHHHHASSAHHHVSAGHRPPSRVVRPGPNVYCRERGCGNRELKCAGSGPAGGAAGPQGGPSRETSSQPTSCRSCTMGGAVRTAAPRGHGGVGSCPHNAAYSTPTAPTLSRGCVEGSCLGSLPPRLKDTDGYPSCSTQLSPCLETPCTSCETVNALPRGLETPNIIEDSSSISVSFAGCGFLGIYHVGVAACLRQYAPHLLEKKLAGASAGALAAALLLCNADLGVITSSVLKTATEARARALGPFSPTFDVERLLREGLLTVLPANAHEIVNGRLFVSVTRVSDGKNVLLSHFETREELVQALLCSAFIPGFSGYRPLSIRGVRYMDGGFSDNVPELDTATVTVSPFCGEADVCPKDSTAGIITISLANTSIEISRENLQRFARILFPPPPETLSRMCQQGFNDALDFLQRNNLIACTRCVAVQSTLPLGGTASREHPHPSPDPRSPSIPQWQEEWESCADCPDCRQQRQEAVLDELPDQVVSILQEAIEAANAGVHRWRALSATRKVASVLTLPAVYSVRVPLALARGLWSRLRAGSLGLNTFVQQVAELLRAVVLSRRHAAVQKLHDAAPLHHHHRPPLHTVQTLGADSQTSAFSCNLAITEYSGSSERREASRSPHHDPWRYYDSDVSEGADETGYDSESEALRHIALQYAERSSRRASLIPQLVTHGPSRPSSRSQSRVPSRAQSRTVSRAVSRRTSVSEGCPPWGGPAHEEDQPPDTLERILTVTGEQDALMAYYYLDEHNQMQVTEIFDMSEAVAAEDAMMASSQGPLGGRSCGAGGHLAPPPPGAAAWTTNQRPAPGILKKSLSVAGETLSGEDSQQHQEDYIFSQLTKFWDSCESSDSVAGTTACRGGSSAASTGSPPSEPEADQHLALQ